VSKPQKQRSSRPERQPSNDPDYRRKVVRARVANATIAILRREALKALVLMDDGDAAQLLAIAGMYTQAWHGDFSFLGTQPEPADEATNEHQAHPLISTSLDERVRKILAETENAFVTIAYIASRLGEGIETVVRVVTRMEDREECEVLTNGSERGDWTVRRG
jgi:hypothetical protein